MNDIVRDTASIAEATPETRLQCRHILTDGHRCGSPCLRRQDFCYYHHTTRKPLSTTEARVRNRRQATFALPLLEDRSAIQRSIGEVLARIVANEIDPRRAGLLLYGLQIASLNLPKAAPAAAPSIRRAAVPKPMPTIEDITLDPILGPIAPVAEYREDPGPKSVAELMLEELEELNHRPARQRAVYPAGHLANGSADRPSAPPATLSTVHAVAASCRSTGRRQRSKVPVNVPRFL